MEFSHAFAALLCFVLVGANYGREAIPDEYYWQALWPKTPIPSSLKELLKPGPEEADDYLPAKHKDKYPKVLFFDHDLYPGKTMNLLFSKRFSANNELAFRQTFLWIQSSIKDYQKLKGFAYYEAVCMTTPINGERKYCAKSLETMIEFAISVLGNNKNILALSSSLVEEQNNYIIEGVQNLGNMAVMCHKLNIQKVVFYCHETHETTSSMVQMVAADGTRSKAIAICHHETSGMNSELLYELLKVKPGTTSVCHFLSNKEVMWVPNLLEVENANMAS